MAWNDPGGNSGGGRNNPNNNPWGNRPEQGPPDLDQVLRNLRRRLSGFFSGGRGGGGNGGGSSSGSGPRVGGLGIGTLVLILIIIWSFTGFYQVDAAERGIVTRFGKFVAKTEPGLRWHLPWPIERKQLVDIQRVEGFTHQTRMLTQDENLVDINLAVQFRRADPLLYAFNVRDPDKTLEEVSESAIREVIGRSKLDAVLESGRQEIAAKTEDLIRRTLNAYNTGIEVRSVNLQGVSVPDPVRPAQEDAIKAREDRERQSLEAQAYANDLLPRARGTAVRQVQDAQAYRAKKIADSEGEAQRFTKLLGEYEQAPAVTRERLYIETVESVLSSAKKVVIDTKGNGSGNLVYLPIDKLMEQARKPSRGVTTSEPTSAVSGSATAPSSNDDRRARGTR
jgi:membrane protease subunit HflK